MLRSKYLAVIIRVSLYVIVFEQPRISGKNLLCECSKGKWCENGNEQNEKKIFSSTKDSNYIEVIASKFLLECLEVISQQFTFTFLSKNNLCSNEKKNLWFDFLIAISYKPKISNPFKKANLALNCNFSEYFFENKQNTKCVGKKQTLSVTLNEW